MQSTTFVKKYQIPLLVAAGLAIGFVNGFFGGGGGMLCVPALTLVMGLNTKQSHATALAVMLPLCTVSAIVYLTQGKVDLPTLLPTGGGFLAGGVLGAVLLNKLKSNVVALIFAAVMIFAGVNMLL